MTLEVAVLDVIPSEANSFECDFAKAKLIIGKMKGYQGHKLLRSFPKGGALRTGAAKADCG